MSTQRVTGYVTPEIKQRLIAFARDQRRSESELVAIALETYLNRRDARIFRLTDDALPDADERARQRGLGQ